MKKIKGVTVALKSIEAILHLYINFETFEEEDEFGVIEDKKAKTIPPALKLDLVSKSHKMDTLLDELLDIYAKYSQKPLIKEAITSIKLTGFRGDDARESYKQMLNVIICNIVELQHLEHKYMRVSMDKVTYQGTLTRYNPSGLKYDKTRNLILFLALHDYIDLYYTNKQFGVYRQETQFKLTKKMTALLHSYNITSYDVTIHDNTEFIFLRENKKKTNNNKEGKEITYKSKKLLPYTDTQETNYRRDVLKDYYDIILWEWYDRVKNAYMPKDLRAKCIYNNEIGRGGRIYAPWQNISSENRKKILIDDSPVVEIDLKSCSLRIAAHLLRLDIKQNDLYSINGHKKEHVKPIVLQMLNMKASKGRTLNQLINDIANSWELKAIEGLVDTENIKMIARDIYEYYNSDEMNKLSEKMFFKDKGMTDITPVETAMTIEIIKEFTDEGEVVLGIHDSFIVKQELTSRLILSIYKNYRKLVGKSPIMTLNNEVVDVASWF